MGTIVDERIKQIAAWLRRFIAVDQITELRALKVDGGQTWAGWFTGDDLEPMARAAIDLEGRSIGVYFTPNPLKETIGGEPINEVKRRAAGGAANDAAIDRRTWLLIDVDPVRIGIDGKPLADQKAPANDSEREAAWQVLLSCKSIMAGQGLAGDVIACSGNGWHLCYPISLPNDDASKAIHEKVLKELAELCSNEAAHVDKSTFNASRIWKLYGTQSRKGAPTGERPFRWSNIASADESNQQYAETNTAALKRFLEVRQRQRDIRTRVDRPSAGSDRASRARAYVAKEPPAISGQHGHDRTFHVAAIIVEGFGIDAEAEFFDAIRGWNGTCLPPWSDKELAHKFADATKKADPSKRGYMLRDSQAASQSVNGQATAAPAATTIGKMAPPDQGINCEDLMTLELPEPVFVVADLITEGVTILASKPKQGKSFLSLQIALAVSQGRDAFPGLATSQGKVLYLALEDTRRRLKTRVAKILQSTGGVPSANLEFRTLTHRSDQGGLDNLLEWLEANKGAARLIIIDTLAKFRPVQRGKQDGYGDDYQTVGNIKTVADRYGVAVLIVHHTRKMGGDSPFDEVSGTLGLTGAADSTWVIKRSADDGTLKMYLTGRDIEECTLGLEFDRQKMLWSIKFRDDGIHAPEADGPKAKDSRTAECGEWLRGKLIGGPCRVATIRTAAELEGYGAKTLYAARDLIEAVEYEEGKRKWWQLPRVGSEHEGEILC